MNDGVEYQDFSWMTLADIRREAAVDKSSPCHNTPSSNSSPKQDNKSEDDDVGDFNQLSPSIGSAEKEACFVINDSFEQAVTLLRADVVSLCLHCGMAPSSLRPSEAILLNLDELRRHLQGLCNSEWNVCLNIKAANMEITVILLFYFFSRRKLPFLQN